LIIREYGFTPHYLVCRAGGRIAGILPLFYIRNFTGRKLVSLPGAMYAGPAAIDDAHSTRLLQTARDYCRAHDARLQVPVPQSLIDDPAAQPFEIDSRVPVTGNAPEDVLARLPTLTRRGLSKSFRSNTEIRFGRHELLDALYTALLHTRRKLGLPLPRRQYYAAILDKVESGVIAACVGGEAVAACLYLVDERHVHYAVPGALPAARTLGAGDRIVWELILLARTKGKAALCLGGSPAWHEGLLSFKRRWGSVQRPVYSFPYTQSTAAAHAVKKRGIRAIKFIPARLIGPASRFAIKHFY
ncbi:MAG TPA: GNAT family N-acetyltransferase, partial [Gammaproteobacteria bacterium]|nr:GNAT family N-acetyltransferase [Gammaproteobacteria bacterium]